MNISPMTQSKLSKEWQHWTLEKKKLNHSPLKRLRKGKKKPKTKINLSNKTIPSYQKSRTERVKSMERPSMDLSGIHGKTRKHSLLEVSKSPRKRQLLLQLQSLLLLSVLFSSAA